MINHWLRRRDSHGYVVDRLNPGVALQAVQFRLDTRNNLDLTLPHSGRIRRDDLEDKCLRSEVGGPLTASVRLTQRPAVTDTDANEGDLGRVEFADLSGPQDSLRNDD